MHGKQEQWGGHQRCTSDPNSNANVYADLVYLTGLEAAVSEGHMSPVGPVSNFPALCECPGCLTESKAAEVTWTQSTGL